ncbi:YoaH family protein [Ferrimonas senticii]|nr:YoaH family protein [Ferrimonas senticii]
MSDLLGLSHQQQQQAAERINQLRAERGLSMAEAVKIVVAELKAQHQEQQ